MRFKLQWLLLVILVLFTLAGIYPAQADTTPDEARHYSIQVVKAYGTLRHSGGGLTWVYQDNKVAIRYRERRNGDNYLWVRASGEGRPVGVWHNSNHKHFEDGLWWGYLESLYMALLAQSQ